MVEAVGIGGESWRFHRDAGDWVALGDVSGEADGIGARVGVGRAEIVEVGVAEGVANDGVSVVHAEPRIVQQHQPDIDGDATVIRQFAQHVTLLQ